MRRNGLQREVRRAEWLAVGAVAVVALVGFVAPANAANKAVSVVYTTSGTNCTTPQGQIYTAEGIGLDSSGTVAVCTAYSTGSTAWQYCNHNLTGNTSCSASDNPAMTQTQVFLLGIDTSTLVAKAQLCSSSLVAWNSVASCTYTNGTCTWSAYAAGIN